MEEYFLKIDYKDKFAIFDCDRTPIVEIEMFTGWTSYGNLSVWWMMKITKWSINNKDKFFMSFSKFCDVAWRDCVGYHFKYNHHIESVL